MLGSRITGSEWKDQRYFSLKSVVDFFVVVGVLVDISEKNIPLSTLLHPED